MAKELPYFKFEPNSWDNGKIQMCTKESKGLFVDLCALYWSRLGELPYALALQKHCNGDNSALQELEKLEIIGVIDGQITIEFLDEQLEEFQITSEKRRNAANKRWKDASALQVQSKSNARREEKRRKEEIREEEGIGLLPPSKWKEFLNSQEDLLMQLSRLGVDATRTIDAFITERQLSGAKSPGDLKQHCYNWAKARPKPQPKNIGRYAT